MSQVLANPLSYVGVRSTNPPQLTFQKRAPTPNDTSGFKIGDQWLVNNPLLAPPIQIWILGSFASANGEILADWVEIYPGQGAGVLTFDTPNGVAVPNNDVITFDNSDGNLVISGFASAVNFRFSDDIDVVNTIHAGGDISTDRNFVLPVTGSNPSLGGYLMQDTDTLLHTYGTQNLFLGTNAGDPAAMTNIASSNTGLGFASMLLLTDGSENTAVGAGAMAGATTDTNATAVGFQALLNATGTANNCAIGWNTGSNITTGNNNCLLGTGTGGALSIESNNIYVGNSVVGTVGDSGVIRIGSALHTSAYIKGVAGVVVPNPTKNIVTIDTVTGQLGSEAAGAGGGVDFTTSSGPTGTLTAVTFTGAGGIAITSAGSTITFTGGGGGGGSLNTLTGNTGGAVSPDGANNISVLGAGTVSVTGNPGTNTLTAAITGGTLHQVLQSAGAGNAVFSTATYPATSLQGDLMISSAANTYTNLAKSAVATRYLANTGIGNNPAWDQVHLTTGVTGVLPIANGGTNANTMATTNGVNYYDGTRLVTTGVGTAGQVLTSHGIGVAPSFEDLGAGLLDAFLAILPTDTGAVTGDGTVYPLGSTVALTEVYDTGNAFNPGNGAGTGCSFTAPATGKYFFYASVVSATYPFTTIPPAAPTNCIIIATNARTYYGNFPVPVNPGNQQNGQTMITVIADMTAGDVATFSWRVDTAVGNKTINATGGSTVAGMTYITGYRLTAVSSGGIRWSTKTSNFNIAMNNAYIVTTAGSQVVATLPVLANVGDVFTITTTTTNGFKIAQNAGQVMYFQSNTTSTGVTGSIATRNTGGGIGKGCGITLVCSIANTEFTAVNSTGANGPGGILSAWLFT